MPANQRFRANDQCVAPIEELGQQYEANSGDRIDSTRLDAPFDIKRYDAPQTPCVRLLAVPSTPVSMRARLEAALGTLDPLRLREEIRNTQHQLACLADEGMASLSAAQQEDLQRFLMRLATAWRAGEVWPTHRERKRKPHDWRTRKVPLEAVWLKLLSWFGERPDQSAKMLFNRLHGEHPGEFDHNQLRTLQRRMCQWRLQRGAQARLRRPQRRSCRRSRCSVAHADQRTIHRGGRLDESRNRTGSDRSVSVRELRSSILADRSAIALVAGGFCPAFGRADCATALLPQASRHGTDKDQRTEALR